MDQEGNNGRRRSSRLAARGIVTTPKPEIIVKKSVKSSEKPKRSKRKTTEEIIELPEAKKTKTEEKTSSDEIDNPEKNTNNVDKVDENDISGISPMDVDNVEETNVSPPSDVDKKDLPTVEEKTDIPVEDSKDQEDVEKLPVANDEKEKDIKSVETDDKKSEITEELIKVKDSEITEQPVNDAVKDEPKQEPVALENTNGKIDGKEKIEKIEEIVTNDIGFCVATKDVVTPNGDAVEQIKSTNGGESIEEVLEDTEPIKVVHVETDFKAVTATTAITTNNDEPVIGQVEKELDESADNVVDNNISAPADDNAPKVDQLSTVVS